MRSTIGPSDPQHNQANHHLKKGHYISGISRELEVKQEGQNLLEFFFAVLLSPELEGFDQLLGVFCTVLDVDHSGINRR